VVQTFLENINLKFFQIAGQKNSSEKLSNFFAITTRSCATSKIGRTSSRCVIFITWTLLSAFNTNPLLSIAHAFVGKVYLGYAPSFHSTLLTYARMPKV